ncbi:MAG TPA: hypothetical protein PL085_14535 [Agriterribacter sp.]|uniref:hypothetical protein n=1 Tax=Agriterribacter sp. TaxID=2821509 RepID=UPI002D0E037D|nr:hypothetical protein [Agriterribacter sp.]HRQ18289.1 hypothetical protein [Agriterribacter sp.]
MEKLHDLDGFTKILSGKGYTGYFSTQGAYPGKLKESISEYLESCRKGWDTYKADFLLTGYLQWRGEDEPSVQCCLQIKQQGETFDLSKIVITKQDCFGQLLKQSELTNLSVNTVPEVSKALAMVNDIPGSKIGQHNRGIRL